ncbi:DUF3696 domain-containing protein [bacterium]|nr:DUF3696 domain-containing protein [bacterium]
MSLPTLTNLSVSGVKSIHKQQSIAVRPLTILAGANSSGKSSMIQALLLLKQTLEAQGDPDGLLLDGPNVCFTRVEQLLSRSSGAKSSDGFDLAIETSPLQSCSLRYRHDAKRGTIDLVEALMRDHPGPLSQLHIGMTTNEIQQNISAGFDVFKKAFHRHEWKVTAERGLPHLRIMNGPSGARADAREAGMNLPLLTDMEAAIQHIIHVPGLRGNAQRTYPRRATGPKFDGTFEHYVASLIARWQEERQNDKLKALQRDLKWLGLTWMVEASRPDDTQISLKVGRLKESRRGGAPDLVDIADVGFGVSQSLPVLVALLAAQPGQVVYLEQPEIHLHPLAQRRLAEVLGRAAKDGKTVIVETHSALLLRAVQTLIANGTLSPDEVAFHWFTRDDDGHTSVETAELDENGAYGAWPTDFDSTELEAEMAYLDAIEARDSRQ